MNKLIVLVCAALACVSTASAQDNPTQAALLAVEPASTNVYRPNLSAVTLVPAAPTAKPSTPQPAPRFGLHEEESWQLSACYTYVRFRSTPFDVSLNGISSTVAKYFNESFAVEGTVTAAFGPEVFPTEHAKYLFYGGGLRGRWQIRRRLEPWGHVVVGGVHMQPQTAGNSRSSFAFALGGGVDWRWKPQVAWRVQADWVRSQLYQGSQNNFQIATGIVFDF